MVCFDSLQRSVLFLCVVICGAGTCSDDDSVEKVSVVKVRMVSQPCLRVRVVNHPLCPMSSRGKVRVLYRKGLHSYSARYDVLQETFVGQYKTNSEPVLVVQPVWDVVQDRFLMGARLKSGKVHAPCSVGLMLSDVFSGKGVESRYELCSFVSEVLCDLVKMVFPAIGALPTVDIGCEALTEDVLRTLPGYRGIVWSVKRLEYFWRDYGKGRDDKVCLIFGREALVGTVVDAGSVFIDPDKKSSLLWHNVEQTKDDLLQIYRYSAQIAGRSVNGHAKKGCFDRDCIAQVVEGS